MSRVREFRTAFEQPAPSAPTVPDRALAALRMRLIREEYEEVQAESDKLLRALSLCDTYDQNPANYDEIVGIIQAYVKEVCDLLYVTEGTLVALGVYPDAYDEVHRSNMSKLGRDGKPVRRDDGKALKGPDYSPADPAKLFPSIINHKED